MLHSPSCDAIGNKSWSKKLCFQSIPAFERIISSCWNLSDGCFQPMPNTHLGFRRFRLEFHVAGKIMFLATFLCSPFSSNISLALGYPSWFQHAFTGSNWPTFWQSGSLSKDPNAIEVGRAPVEMPPSGFHTITWVYIHMESIIKTSSCQGNWRNMMNPRILQYDRTHFSSLSNKEGMTALLISCSRKWDIPKLPAHQLPLVLLAPGISGDP